MTEAVADVVLTDDVVRFEVELEIVSLVLTVVSALAPGVLRRLFGVVDELPFVDGGGLGWFTDSRGRSVGIPARNVAFIEMEDTEGSTAVGFAPAE